MTATATSRFEPLVVREVDALAAALAEEAAHGVAAAGEGCGERRRGRRCGAAAGCDGVADGALAPARTAASRNVRASAFSGSSASTSCDELVDARPFAAAERGLGLVEEAVDLALDAFAWHGSPASARVHR